MRRHGGLEQRLASVLYLGSLLACSIITLGIILSLFHGRKELPSATGTKVAAAGISLLIFLPTLRVVLMLSAFVRDRDLVFSGISMLVLVIIALGATLGIAW
jgi:uncharacterized membrane protein